MMSVFEKKMLSFLQKASLLKWEGEKYADGNRPSWIHKLLKRIQ